MAWGSLNIPLPEWAAGASPGELAVGQQFLQPELQGGGGGDGGHFYDEGLGHIFEMLASLGFSQAEAQAALEENARQFDQNLAFQYYNAQQAVKAASIGAGASMYGSDISLQIAETNAANALEIARLNNATDRWIAQKEFEIRLQEMMSGERITAATIWSQPIDYLAYNRWMLDLDSMTTESGLPVGAPAWHTGEPEEATVGTGPVATGGVDVYGQALAEGQRMPAFNAWGGPTTPVEGTPWIPPHKQNVEMFSMTPDQARQMAFGRWRHRGITGESAEQAMWAAAPTGTATAVGYG